MRSIPQALLWEILSHGRWSIPGCFLLANLMPVLVYGALSGFPFDPTNQEFVVLQFAFIPILVLQLAGGLVTALGPVSRLYFAPISASSIVAWHMVAGAAILAGETVLAAWLYNTVFHVNWPILGAGLFAAAAWSAIQLLICASTRSFVMVCIGGLPGVLLCLWLQSRFGAWFSPPKHFWNEVTAIDFATLAFTFGVCTVLSAWSVQWSRCGEHPLKLRLLSWIDAQLNSILASRKINRFRSPAAAQFWFEWQLKGRALPICTLIVVLVFSIFGFGIWCIDRVNPTKLYEVVLILGGLLSLLAIAFVSFTSIQFSLASSQALTVSFFISLVNGLGPLNFLRIVINARYDPAIAMEVVDDEENDDDGQQSCCEKMWLSSDAVQIMLNLLKVQQIQDSSFVGLQSDDRATKRKRQKDVESH
jgi:hypothetical protein